MVELNEDFISQLSNQKKEPKWMLDFRIKSFHQYQKMILSNQDSELDLDLNQLLYYKKINDKTAHNWGEVDTKIHRQFCNLGVVKAEAMYLSGVNNQIESEVVYSKNYNQNGVIFLSTDEALQQYPDLVKKYWGTLVTGVESKYAALNGALWSGGTFVYLPPHTKLKRPLQGYYRIETENLGQFERTIIIASEGSELDYMEGCTASQNLKGALHAGVTEIFVQKKARVRFTTIQNWALNIYNLTTAKALVATSGILEWIEGQFGSKVTRKYPVCILKGAGAIGNSTSISCAKKGQYLDTGVHMIHLGHHTKSNIISKSLATSGGIANYRGSARIESQASNSQAQVRCDSLLLDQFSQSNTYPQNVVANPTSDLVHEATISKIKEEAIFYLMSKGLTRNRAQELLVLGFLNEFKKELPMEYAVELNRLLNN